MRSSQEASTPITPPAEPSRPARSSGPGLRSTASAAPPAVVSPASAERETALASSGESFSEAMHPCERDPRDRGPAL
jgi:hypothetical protein